MLREMFPATQLSTHGIKECLVCGHIRSTYTDIRTKGNIWHLFVSGCFLGEIDGFSCSFHV
ncbi:hypothetical protein HanRHA438_Chr05g0222041 [Helianthus annuus]|nr:hypothetical protein HanRHA438_Chr05g0222041 [Helianthus annuus]